MPITVLMIDLDHFKKVNDTYGHQFGDTCLIEAASQLSKILTRKTDTVARYGGEEFIILLPNTNIEDGAVIADKTVHAVTSIALQHEGINVQISCSIV